jgi:CRP-like cAMP-binding protein
MKGFKFLEINKGHQALLSSMILRESYRPHSMVPINNRYIYIVEKGMLRCFAIDRGQIVTIALVVEDDIFGVPELMAEMPDKYSALYYCAEENTKIVLLDKERWYDFMVQHDDFKVKWEAQIEKQKYGMRQWLCGLRNNNKARLFVRLMQTKPQLLKKNRLRHLYEIFNLKVE